MNQEPPDRPGDEPVQHTIDRARPQEPVEGQGLEQNLLAGIHDAEVRRMECKHHLGVEAVDRCAGCSEAFCSDCLVEIQGRSYCSECKIMAVRDGAPPIPEGQMKPCKEAGEALTFAIVGIFCLGIILEPIAISKALKAKRLIEADPRLTGSGKATAALTIGIIALVFWVLGILARFAEA
ncbi:MAG: DUF4190 domain-containing protein [Gemmatimonadota bacterium]|nr:MAG: DUF4190 domain-containing protein [Gemmatimonadota bacterium]